MQLQARLDELSQLTGQLSVAKLDLVQLEGDLKAAQKTAGHQL